MFAGMMNPGAPAPLRFANVDAVLYGFDLDWSWRLSDRLSLGGIVNYVRGERDDIDDNLYRIAPFNTTVALDYSAGTWGTSLEAVLVADQDDVSATNRELATDGYELLNVAAWWSVTPGLRLAAGVDNLLDERFADHLNGVNRVNGNPDLASGERLPGLGINGFLRVDYRF
jgi:iron complex outermembrane receptor protein